jgi:hypothetical protein
VAALKDGEPRRLTTSKNTLRMVEKQEEENTAAKQNKATAITASLKITITMQVGVLLQMRTHNASTCVDVSFDDKLSASLTFSSLERLAR